MAIPDHLLPRSGEVLRFTAVALQESDDLLDPIEAIVLKRETIHPVLKAETAISGKNRAARTEPKAGISKNLRIA